ncbi:GTPase IMAP family member 9 [Alosa alosa]|uniref:GTPase IMAP family member 9 n=1 Tax=Alosa alosa TaxID=278164 RepID=UPI0020150BC9|nr:GTPase IMAP family member 9 [Alosa alosa]
MRAEKERMEREKIEREKTQKEERATSTHRANGLHSQMSPQKQQLLEQQRTYEDKQQKTKGSSLPTAEGAILSQFSDKTSDKKTLKSIYHRVTTGDDLSPAVPELRLVLLGGSGSGKSAAGNAILGRKEFESRADTGVTQTCEKGRVILGNKRVAVVDTPDWFRSERTPDEVRSQLSSCVALSTPGPHAFLFCVPLHRPSDAGQLQALGALEGVFGAGAVWGHTLVLFTHADRLKEWSGGVARVEEYIASKRPDLLKLVEKCGDRYHILERPGSEGGGGGGGGGGGEEVERRSVEELLEKVEQTVRESGDGHYSCPLYQEADSRVRDRQAELLQVRRERSREHLVTLQEEEEDEAAEVERTRDEAEKSIQLDSVPVLSLPPAQSSSFLRSVGEKVAAGVVAGARKVPKVLAGGALLGGGLGVFLGGLIGGAVGVTGGVALAEVARRKLSSKRTESDGQKVDEKKVVSALEAHVD